MNVHLFIASETCGKVVTAGVAAISILSKVATAVFICTTFSGYAMRLLLTVPCLHIFFTIIFGLGRILSSRSTNGGGGSCAVPIFAALDTLLGCSAWLFSGIASIAIVLGAGSMVLPLAIVTIACLGCKTFCAVATVIFYEPSKAEAEALSKQGKVRHIVTNLLLLLPSVAVGVALFLCLPVAAAVPLLVVPSEWFSERAVNAIYLLRRSVAA